jgi:group I intron endonuclease
MLNTGNIIIYNYLTTNKINNKQYVGMHCTFNVEDNYLGSGKYLLKAIRKYGKENFTREILCICTSVEEAHKKEEEYIKYYSTLKPFGYNLSPTGGLKYGGTHSEEVKKQISESSKGRIFSEESKQKLKNSISGEKHWCYGKKQSKESIEKRRISMIGKNKGKKQKLETVEKNRQSHLGNKHTEETKIKIGLASKNRIITDETKEKLRQAALKQWDRQLNRVRD